MDELGDSGAIHLSVESWRQGWSNGSRQGRLRLLAKSQINSLFRI